VSLETQLYTALKSLVSNRVHRDLTPERDTDGKPVPLPRITFQQVGGESINFLEGGQVGLRQPRVQVNVWHSRRDDANALAIEVENALRSASGLQTKVLADFVAVVEVMEDGTRIYGTHQDFQFGTT
jgi:hypothetical protein